MKQRDHGGLRIQLDAMSVRHGIVRSRWNVKGLRRAVNAPTKTIYSEP